MRRMLEIQTRASMPSIGDAPGLYEAGNALYIVQAQNMPAMFCGWANAMPVIQQQDSLPTGMQPSNETSREPLVVLGITPDHMIKLAAVLLDPANAPQLYAKVEA